MRVGWGAVMAPPGAHTPCSERGTIIPPLPCLTHSLSWSSGLSSQSLAFKFCLDCPLLSLCPPALTLMLPEPPSQDTLSHLPACTCCSLCSEALPNLSHLPRILILLVPPPDPPQWSQQRPSMMRRQFLFTWPLPPSRLSAHTEAKRG